MWWLNEGRLKEVATQITWFCVSFQLFVAATLGGETWQSVFSLFYLQINGRTHAPRSSEQPDALSSSEQPDAHTLTNEEWIANVRSITRMQS